MESEKKIEIDNKYSRGKIYRLICDTTGLVYIGSTIEKLSRRLSKHRADYKRFLNKKQHFISSYKILENDNYKIILIVNFPCNSKEELHREERKYIETMDCINKIIPTRTNKEYKQQNKEHFKEYHKQYREENKEQIKIKKQEYYHENKERLHIKNKEYNENNKDKIKENTKEYRENNKEQIKIKKKEHYEKNKKIILANKKVKVICDNCGCEIRKDGLAEHKKSLKCINFKKI